MKYPGKSRAISENYQVGTGNEGSIMVASTTFRKSLMLTDLEAAAIGDILKHQPCTAHFVRTCFRESPANRFSDSAGSVYPMMKRLEKRTLLESLEQTDGLRQVRYYRCTRAGRSELRKWLGPPFDDGVTLTIDPLRTRILFLHRLPKSQRVNWFRDAELALRKKLALVQQQLAGHSEDNADSVYLELADENALMELKCRLNWLTKAKRRLSSTGQI